MFVDLKSIFLASLMFVEFTQKISEWRLMEKKVYDNFKNLKNCNLKKMGLIRYFTNFSYLFMCLKQKVYIG